MQSISIIYVLSIITILCFLIENYINIKNKKTKKIISILKIFFIILVIIILLSKVLLLIKDYNENIRQKKIFETYDKEIKKEEKYYESFIEKQYNYNLSKTPYIPDGFHYVEGEWNTGFVIEDENNNQYVWVPCSNIEDEEVVKLEKKKFVTYELINKDECYDDNYEEFIKSSLENCGFYISRFEIGIENNTPVSKANINPYNNITKEEVIKHVEQMKKNYNNINCELINGYAYDTALSWIIKTNDIETQYSTLKNESSSILTGRNKYNNIYDITDNIMEYTNENNYETVVIRGFPLKREEKELEDIEVSDYDTMMNRYTINENENNFILDGILTFRTIIYK